MDARDHERGQANAARETVRVRLLGGFRLAVGRREVPNEAWRLRKAQALVKLLALAPGHALHREQAMDLLWPNLGRKAASNNLRGALHAARQALDPDRRRGPAGLDSEGERIDRAVPGGEPLGGRGGLRGVRRVRQGEPGARPL